MPEFIFEHDAVTSLIQGYVGLVVIAVGAFSIIAIMYVLNDVLRDSRQYQRKQVLKNYRKAEAHIRWKLERSEVTGVLYSYRKGA